MRSNASEPTDTAAPRDYDPPRVTVIGTVRELTQAIGGGGTDAAVFTIGPSDRRLKEHVREVDGRAVLTALAAL